MSDTLTMIAQASEGVPGYVPIAAAGGAVLASVVYNLYCDSNLRHKRKFAPDLEGDSQKIDDVITGYRRMFKKSPFNDLFPIPELRDVYQTHLAELDAKHIKGSPAQRSAAFMAHRTFCPSLGAKEFYANPAVREYVSE